jgi:hypothetical protein
MNMQRSSAERAHPPLSVKPPTLACCLTFTCSGSTVCLFVHAQLWHALFCMHCRSFLIHAEAFSRAGYFTVECEAPNPRLYSFEGAICCWDFPPTYNPHPTIAPTRQNTTASAAAAAAARASGSISRQQEVELIAAAAAAPGSPGGSGWYANAGREQQQQQQGGSPKGSRREGSPSRRRQAAGRGSEAGADSMTAALGEYGQQVRATYAYVVY